MNELVAVRFGDAAFLVPRAIADQCARLRDAGSTYNAMVLARDHHTGGANIVPSGTTIHVPLAFADAAIPERFREGIRSMSEAPTTHTSLNDANAEVARLRAEVHSLKGVNAALLANIPAAGSQGRNLLDVARDNALRDAARDAVLAEERQRQSGPAGQAARRIANAWKAPAGA